MRGPGEAGEPVDQHDHVVAGLGDATGPGEGEFEDGDVVVGVGVERRAVDGAGRDERAPSR